MGRNFRFPILFSDPSPRNTKFTLGGMKILSIFPIPTNNLQTFFEQQTNFVHEEYLICDAEIQERRSFIYLP